MQWGRPERGEDPDVCYVWGPGIHKSDAALLNFVIGSPRYGYQGFKEEPMPSLLDELKKRGYDLTTLKLSVKLAAPPYVHREGGTDGNG